MQNKKQKKTKDDAQESHIFEIHTMQSDIEKNKQAPKQSMSGNQIQNNIGSASNKEKYNIQTQAKTKKPIDQTDNPFLTQEVPTPNDIGKGSFAPGKQKEPIEKINQTPADIVFDEELDKKQSVKPPKSPKPVKSSKKTMSIVIIVIIIVVLIGIVGFGFVMLKSNAKQAMNNVPDVDTVPVNITNPIEDIEDDINKENENNINEITKQTYSTDLPNYFSIDVESATVKDDIEMELDAITKNMTQENIQGPISFIITDINNNPVSFHIFAISAKMNIPQNILTSLEEDFELYAYNDEMTGVRFGFAIDAKNPDNLKTELLANESALPESFDLILNGLGASAVNVVFNDSTYETHPVRYFNLNESETYSVDYTINDMRFVIGASKDTLRKMIDYLKSSQMPVVIEDNLE